MKWQVKNLIIFFVLIFSMQNAFCYVLSPAEIQKTIYNKINQEYKTELSKYSDDYKINIFGIPQEKIITQENCIPKIEVVSQETSFQPNSYKRIIIKNSKNQILKAFSVNVQTKIYKNVLVANSNIQYNQEINSLNTKLERVDITKNLNNIITNIPNSYIAKRNFSKDSIILANSIQKKSVVLKNSLVDIKFLSKGIEIKTQGRALNEGSIGDVILVKSDRYNRTYNATINSSSEVSVRI